MSREREFNRTVEYLFDGVDWSDYGAAMDEVRRRKESLCQGSDSPEEIELFWKHIYIYMSREIFRSSTSLEGVIKNAEGAIAGRNTYARILIR